MKALNLGGVAEGEAHELGEKGARAFRSSHQPIHVDNTPEPGPVISLWYAVASTVEAFLAAARARLGPHTVRIRPEPRHPPAPSAAALPSSASASASTPSLAALRARVPRPTPAFRAARDALTRVLPSSAGERVHKCGDATGARQTWDPPTSPAPTPRVTNAGRMRAFLSHAPGTPPGRPAWPSSAGWQPLATFAVGDSDNEDDIPFASPGRGAGYPAQRFAGGAGRAEHPFAPTPEHGLGQGQGQDPFADPAARGSGTRMAGVDGPKEVSAYKVGGSRWPTPPGREADDQGLGSADPFATPFDGDGER